MGPVLIVVVLPFLQSLWEVGALEIDRRIDFIKIGALRAFYLAVQVWRRRPDRTEFNSVFHELLLEAVGEELSPAIRLNGLHWERRLFDDAI